MEEQEPKKRSGRPKWAPTQAQLGQWVEAVRAGASDNLCATLLEVSRSAMDAFLNRPENKEFATGLAAERAQAEIEVLISLRDSGGSSKSQIEWLTRVSRNKYEYLHVDKAKEIEAKPPQTLRIEVVDTDTVQTED